MKMKKVLLLSLISMFILSMSIPVLGKPNQAPPIFMGEVVEVKTDNSGNVLLLVEGYLKNQKVIKQSVVAVVGPETQIINCDGKAFNKSEFAKGDVVFMVLSEAMTFSIPPQSVAKQIQVCRPVN